MPYAPLGEEFFIHANLRDYHWRPQVTQLEDGRVLVVWSATLDGGNGRRIQGQFYEADGTALGSPVVLTPTEWIQEVWDVTALPNGGFALSWTKRDASEPQPLTVKFFDASGAPVSGDIVLAAGSGLFPSELAALADGKVAVVSTSTGTTDVAARIVAPDGTVQALALDSSGTMGDGAGVAVLDNGNIVITWDDSGGAGDGDGSIKAQIFTPGGTPLGGAFLVNTATAGIQSIPNIAALPSGGFVVLWGSPAGGRGQIFDSAGNKVGAEFPALNGQISVRPDGGFVVTFGSDDIWAQEYAADGTRVRDTYLVNNVTDRWQHSSDSALLDNGNLFVVWMDESRYRVPSGVDAKARILQPPTEGTDENDLFTGTAGWDYFMGHGGRDTFLLQHGGRDVAEGGEGNDVFYGGSGFDDTVDGGAGIDTLILQGDYPAGNLALSPLRGVEAIHLWTYTNAAYGGADSTPNTYFLKSVDANVAAGSGLTVDGRQLVAGERLFFNGSAESDGAFFLYGGGGDDNLLGGAGRDTLDGGTGADVLLGGGGDDRYFVDHVNDQAGEDVGGGGFDAVYSRVNYTLRAGSEVEMLAANALPAGFGIALAGNEFGQSVIGGGGNDTLSGGGGNDFLTGNAGNDRLDGGTGIDVMTGGAGNDAYFVDNGGDVVVEAAGGGGADAVYTSMSYALRAGSEVETLAANAVAAGVGVTLRGNEFAQNVIGAGGNDALFGGGGNDHLVGNAGNDQLTGGSGIDAMSGGAGNDVYFVDDSGDLVQEGAGGGNDAVYTSVHFALGGSAEVELLATTGLAPGQGVDLYGNNFVQSIVGSGGNDRLFGLGGNDALDGGAGDDLLNGGAGVDQLRGGAGTDAYHFSTAAEANGDILFDFAAGEKIDLSAIDADAAAAGDQSFTWIGSGAFTSKAGELRVIQDGNAAQILGDVDGDGTADFHILAYNLAAPLSAGDFTM